MPRQKNERSLGDVDEKLFYRIEKAINSRNDMKKKQFVTAAMEFFLALPENVQDQLLMRSPTSQIFKKLVSKNKFPAAKIVADSAARTVIRKQKKDRRPVKSG